MKCIKCNKEDNECAMELVTSLYYGISILCRLVTIDKLGKL